MAQQTHGHDPARERALSLSPAKRALLERLVRDRAERAAADGGPADGGPAGGAAADGGIVELRAGTRPGAAPVVLVHPIGGGVFCYAELARLVGGDRPVWGIAADAALCAPTSVPALAGHYLRLLAARGAARPALLAGWSFGGLLAHEMARRAARTGAPALPVVLIDAAPWPDGTGPWSPAETLEMFFLDLLGSSGAEADRVPVDAEVWRLPRARALTEAADRLRALGHDLGLSPAELDHRFTVFTHATDAMQRHRPAGHDGPTVLFHAAESDVRPELWEPLATGAPLTAVPVPGDHFALLGGATVHAVARAVRRHSDGPSGPDGRPAHPTHQTQESP